MFVKCPCNHCGNHLEFLNDPEHDGLEIECPSCGMMTRLFVPAAPRAPTSERLISFIGHHRKPITVYSTIGLVLVLLWIIGPHIPDKAAVEVATGIGQIGGGVIVTAILIFLLILLILWIVFPMFVYFQLKRIQTEIIAMRRNSDLIEDHTRKLAERKRSDL